MFAGHDVADFPFADHLTAHVLEPACFVAVILPVFAEQCCRHIGWPSRPMMTCSGCPALSQVNLHMAATFLQVFGLSVNVTRTQDRQGRRDGTGK
jgi:hypothetical protein